MNTELCDNRRWQRGILKYSNDCQKLKSKVKTNSQPQKQVSVVYSNILKTQTNREVWQYV